MVLYVRNHADDCEQPHSHRFSSHQYAVAHRSRQQSLHSSPATPSTFLALSSLTPCLSPASQPHTAFECRVALVLSYQHTPPYIDGPTCSSQRLLDDNAYLSAHSQPSWFSLLQDPDFVSTMPPPSILHALWHGSVKRLSAVHSHYQSSVPRHSFPSSLSPGYTARNSLQWCYPLLLSVHHISYLQTILPVSLPPDWHSVGHSHRHLSHEIIAPLHRY